MMVYHINGLVQNCISDGVTAALHQAINIKYQKQHDTSVGPWKQLDELTAR